MPAGLGTITLPTSVPGTTLPNYGHDLSCTTDLDPAMLEVDGIVTLGQALFRRIITPRGTLIDDPNYGNDLTQYLNDDLSPSDLARVGAGVDAEFLKDERVLRSTTTVTMSVASVLTVSSSVTPNAGPAFRLVAAITQVTSQLLQVSP